MNDTPSRVVYKYLLPDNENDLRLPRGAEPLYFAAQFGQLCLWVLHDLKEPLESRHFKVVGTGNPEFYDDVVSYVGTAMVEGGRWVFHCFEVTS